MYRRHNFLYIPGNTFKIHSILPIISCNETYKATVSGRADTNVAMDIHQVFPSSAVCCLIDCLVVLHLRGGRYAGEFDFFAITINRDELTGVLCFVRSCSAKFRKTMK